VGFGFITMPVGLGEYPQPQKSPKIGGFRGLNTTFSILYVGANYQEANDALRKKDFVLFGQLNIVI
jgi:hypothetical protein